MPSCRIILTLHELANIHMDKLEAKCTIHSLYHNHKPQQVIRVNTAIDSQVERAEVWQRKFSTVIYCENKLENITDTIHLTVQNVPKVFFLNNT